MKLSAPRAACRVTRSAMSKVTLPSTPDEFERYWLAFYRSQFIPERRNLKYFQRMIPKKYWKWVTELKEFGFLS